MHNRMQKHESQVTKIFEKRCQDGARLPGIPPIDQEYSETLVWLLVNNKKFVAEDIQLLEHYQSISLAHAVDGLVARGTIEGIMPNGRIKTVDVAKEVKDFYVHASLEAAWELEGMIGRNAKINNFLYNRMELLNPYQERYVEKNLDDLRRLAHQDVVLEFRQQFMADDAEDLPMVAPYLFDQFNKNILQKNRVYK